MESYVGILDSPHMTGVSALLIELMEVHLAVAPLDRCTGEASRWESNVCNRVKLEARKGHVQSLRTVSSIFRLNKIDGLV